MNNIESGSESISFEKTPVDARQIRINIKIHNGRIGLVALNKDIRERSKIVRRTIPFPILRISGDRLKSFVAQSRTKKYEKNIIRSKRTMRVPTRLLIQKKNFLY